MTAEHKFMDLPPFATRQAFPTPSRCIDVTLEGKSVGEGQLFKIHFQSVHGPFKGKKLIVEPAEGLSLVSLQVGNELMLGHSGHPKGPVPCTMLPHVSWNMPTMQISQLMIATFRCESSWREHIDTLAYLIGVGIE